MMFEFFRGWRPKLGCVLLCPAFVLMTAWVRSEYKGDIVILPDQEYLHQIHSVRGQLRWKCRWGVGGAPSEQFHWSTEGLWFFNLPRRNSLLQRAGFDYFFDVETVTGGIWGERNIAVPYWSIVWPLTALSMWLLVSKPRPRKKSIAVKDVVD